MKKIVNEILNNKLIPFWEIACFYEKDGDVPDELLEFKYLSKNKSFELALTNNILFRNYKKIEISLIGQDKNGYNETCYIIKTIIIKGD